jgi:hypothetical protein
MAVDPTIDVEGILWFRYKKYIMLCKFIKENPTQHFTKCNRRDKRNVFCVMMVKINYDLHEKFVFASTARTKNSTVNASS